jgi:hypothetical protein
MDGRIARLVCTATVVAREGEERQSAALAEGVLKTELPAALPEALERVLAGDPTVYVARSLHCEVYAGLAASGVALARSIATQLARAVRDPDRDGAGLVRFASIEDYLAAFLVALATGDAWRHWYFGPLRRFARLDTRAAFLALGAEGHDMPQILLALKRSGDLGQVLPTIGEEALAQTWPSSGSARPLQAEWLSLVRLALDLARALGWDITGHEDLQAWAAELAAGVDADLDWTDPVGLAHALARALRLVSGTAADARHVSAGQLPAWLDWVDADALVQSLSAPPPSALTPGARAEAPVTAVRPPRTLAIEAALSRLISGGTVVLDRGFPGAASVMLWAALTEQMPELAEAAWARDVVRRFVDRRLGAGPAPPRAETSIRAGADRDPVAAEVPGAGIYLLLRTLDAMRMPALCRRAGVPALALLETLARRWAGPVDVADALRPIVGDTALRPGSLSEDALQTLQAEVIRIALTHRQAAREVVRLRSVPFGATAMALILGDVDDLTWLGGQRQDPASPTGPMPPWWHEVTGGPSPQVEYLAGDADDPGRALLLADLASMAHAHGGDPDIDLPLDLIALTVLRHWARWLRGFGTASVPFLLATFIRRPGRLIAADDGTARVSLSRLPHDVVLEVSGYLDPFDLWWPWGTERAGRVRRVEFTVGA